MCQLKTKYWLLLEKLSCMPTKYQALYNLLLDSGLRLVEAVKLLNDFGEVTRVNGFCRCTLGFFRGSKTAYAGYFTKHTCELIHLNEEKVEERAASHYYHIYKCVAPKYLRKFVFNTMISDGFNFPESVADFIEGRVPRKIGARHYTLLLKQADSHYGKYADYLYNLRLKPF
jgi:intergrase/recombinase